MIGSVVDGERNAGDVAAWDIEPVMEIWLGGCGQSRMITAAGRLDPATAAALLGALDRVRAEALGRAIVDLRPIRECTTKGWSTLAAGLVERRRAGQVIDVVGAGGWTSADVRRVRSTSTLTGGGRSTRPARGPR